MKFEGIELHISRNVFGSRHKLWKKAKAECVSIKSYGRGGRYYVQVSPNDFIADDLIKLAEVVIIRDLDAELTHVLKHGGYVQAWATVYKDVHSVADLRLKVLAMIGRVARRNIESAKLESAISGLRS